GLRYRAFVPSPGLHPGLAAHDPLELRWESGGRALSIAIHGWIPGGGVYEGLPGDAAEAARRRDERGGVREVDRSFMHAFPADAGDGIPLDLRRCAPA